MGASVTGVLAVDEGGDVLAVRVAVAHHYLYVVAGEVDGRVERLFAEVLVDQVQKPVLRLVGRAVQDEGEALVEIGVVLDHSHDIVLVEGVLSEHQRIRGEAYQGAVLFLGGPLRALDELAACEAGAGALAVAVRADIEVGREGVDGLGADAVEPDGLLVVELASGVEYADRIHHLAERDAASEVAYAYRAALDGDLHLTSETGGELVYGVVDYLFEQHIDAVIRAASVPEPADIHSGTEPDVLHPLYGADVVLCVVIFWCHSSSRFPSGAV